jgi:glucosamine-phosphate N-acetyltransferase
MEERPMQHIIRELQESDLSNCFTDTLSGLAEVGLSAGQLRAVMQERRQTGAYTYVALDPVRNEVVGTASLVVECKFIHRGGRCGRIEDVSVRRGFRGQGLGAALVKHAVSEARRLGCYKVILNCFEQLAPLYASMGFRKHDIGMRIDLGAHMEIRG